MAIGKNNVKVAAIAAALACGMAAMTGCASIDSGFKSLEAEMSYLDRHIVVYHPYTGDVLFEKDGKMLIEKSDEGGLRITTASGYRYNIGDCPYVTEEKE